MKSQGTQKQPNKKVFVGISGGVDSAVSAALLQKEGYDVTGVFIKVWQPDWITCNWKEERLHAMRVAAHLDIPFVTLDLEKEYKHNVIDYMIAEYSVGRTPNPDVMCNRYVKFGAFWKWAKEQGADFIATGHYAQVKRIEDVPHRLPVSASAEAAPPSHSPSLAPKVASEAHPQFFFTLLKGVDLNKDQSYFLWTLNQNDLPHVLFPVGHLQKPEVRKLAAKFKLPNALKKDSQGLCFIGKVDVKEFLSHYITGVPGTVENEAGIAIGNHPGALLFTIGERHGFTVTEKTPHDTPYYVVGKDTERNVIVVSNKSKESESQAHTRDVAKLANVNRVVGSIPSISTNSNYPLQARSRYRQPLQNIRIVSATDTEATIEFEMPQDTLTPGQSLVIYDREVCLGGGVIE